MFVFFNISTNVFLFLIMIKLCGRVCGRFGAVDREVQLGVLYAYIGRPKKPDFLGIYPRKIKSPRRCVGLAQLIRPHAWQARSFDVHLYFNNSTRISSHSLL